MTAQSVPIHDPAPPPAGPTETTFRTLLRTIGLLKRVMEPYFAQAGISSSQWAVLRALHRAEEEGFTEIRQKDLSDRLLIRPPSVTGIVERLCRSGWVARSHSPTDQRAKRVTLTSAGRELVQRVLKQHGNQVRAVLSALNETEQAQLDQLLGRLSLHLQNLAEPNHDLD